MKVLTYTLWRRKLKNAIDDYYKFWLYQRLEHYVAMFLKTVVEAEGHVQLQTLFGAKY